MARRQRLTTTQLAELFEPPTEQRELVRHFTLSEADLAAIRRSHGDHNRLGHALMLCYLRYPGRVLRSGERPPAALLTFVAEQVGIFPEAIDAYLAAERSRRHHAVECQRQLGLRPFGRRTAAELTEALLPQAIEDDRFVHMAALVMRTCRERRTIVPSPAALERLCGELRGQARREVYRRLAGGLSTDQRRRLDALTQQREQTGQNWLTWLRQMPQGAKPDAMLGLIERLKHGAIGLQFALRSPGPSDPSCPACSRSRPHYGAACVLERDDLDLRRHGEHDVEVRHVEQLRLTARAGEFATEGRFKSPPEAD